MLGGGERVRPGGRREGAGRGRIPVGAGVRPVAGFALVFLLFPMVASAQEASPEGKTIRSVRVEGNRIISEAAVRVTIRTREGEAYSAATVADDVKRLYELGFSGVEVFAKPEGEGVAVRIVLEENPRIREVTFRGVDHFSEAKLNEIVGLRKGQFASDLILKLAARDLERRYREDGYLFVDVKVLRRGTPEGLEVSIRVIEGPRVKVKDVQIVGNRYFTGAQIRAVMKTSRTKLLRSKYLNLDTLEQDLVAVHSLYRNEGFRDVQVDLADIWYNEAKDRASVKIVVQEGLRYTVRSIRIEGNQLYGDEEILGAMSLHAGEPFVQSRLDADVYQRIPRLYGRKAYIRARVLPEVIYADEGPLADIVIRIREGKKIYMGEIRIEGNRLTRDKVIRREISLAPGDPVNLDELLRSRNRLLDMGFFDPREGVALEKSGPEDLSSDIQDWVVRVREGQTGFLRFAVGVGSNSGVIGEVSVTKRNFDISDPPHGVGELFSGEAFTGGGQTLFLTVSPGTELSRFRIGFREPFLFDTHNSLGIDLFRRVRIWSDYDEQRQGVQLRLGRYLSRFHPDLSLGFHLRAEQVDLRDLDVTAPQDVFDFAGRTNVVGVGPSLRYEELDRPGFPTKGIRAELSYDFVGHALGGDVNYHRVVLDSRGFFPLWEDALGRRHVLSLWSRFGWSEATGGNRRVPIFDRFYAGGRESIRGFDFRGVGPHQNGEPVGGDVLMIGGVEYEFPLLEDVLRGVAFVDAGTVAESIHAEDFRRVRLSAGFGFRLKIPFFGPVPFALDFGFPFLDGPEDDRQTLSFSLGTPFFGAPF